MYLDKDKDMKSSSIGLSAIKSADRLVYEFFGDRQRQQTVPVSHQYHQDQLDSLRRQDNDVYKLIDAEYNRLQNTLQLIAAENQCSQAVLAALGSVVQNKTAEGFPGSRYHAGCEVVDELEKLAVERACRAFGAKYANVQPHSGTTANQIVFNAVLQKGDRILSMAVEQGGHESHSDSNSMTGKFFEVKTYGVDEETLLLDYDVIETAVLGYKPKLIICGATAYPRTIDFERFRRIADIAKAFLLADISHISGLVAAGAHPSPVDWAHFTTTSTYKPGGPRGGLILMGSDFEKTTEVDGEPVPLCRLLESATFPGTQGTPYFNHIAAKAVFFKEMVSEEYLRRQFRIIENAKALAANLSDLGYKIVTGGTDNHMLLVDIAGSKAGLTGLVAEKALEFCGIIANKTILPYDKYPSEVTGGIRLGTAVVTRNGMGPAEMARIACLIDAVLNNIKITGTECELDQAFRKQTADCIADLCSKFPMS